MITTTALLLTAVSCIHVPQPIEPVLPQLTGSSPHAVIARPISIKYFEDHASRYWRAQYEVLAWANHKKRSLHLQKVVVEWSCDPSRDNGDDPCGDLIDHVLPGFGENGRGDIPFVQLDLRYKHASTFDGVELYYAARDGSFRLAVPEPLPYFYGDVTLEQGHREAKG